MAFARCTTKGCPARFKAGEDRPSPWHRAEQQFEAERDETIPMMRAEFATKLAVNATAQDKDDAA